MNKLLIILLFSFSFSSTFLFSQDQILYPKVNLEKTTFNFGTKFEGEVVDFDLNIKNQGEGDFVVEEIITSCGCTVADIKNKRIPPSEKSNLKISFNTAGFRGASEKKIRLFTNDPSNKEIIITLNGNIISEAEVSPRVVKFENVNESLESQSIKSVVKINNKCVPGKLIVNNDNFETKVVSQNSTEIVLETFILKNKGEGIFRGRAILELKNCIRKSINIPVLIRYQKLISVELGSLSFGLIPRDESILTRSVKLANNSTKDFKIEKINYKSKAISHSIKEVPNGFNVIISLDSSKINKDLNEQLKITTNFENQKNINIDLYGVRVPEDF